MNIFEMLGIDISNTTNQVLLLIFVILFNLRTLIIIKKELNKDDEESLSVKK